MPNLLAPPQFNLTSLPSLFSTSETMAPFPLSITSTSNTSLSPSFSFVCNFAFCLNLRSLFPLTSYSVSVTGLIDNPTKLFIKDIKSLPKFNVTATLQCAGNIRTAMSKVRKVRGVGWDVSAIGNGSFFLSPKIYLFFFYNTKTV